MLFLHVYNEDALQKCKDTTFLRHSKHLRKILSVFFNHFLFQPNNHRKTHPSEHSRQVILGVGKGKGEREK